MRGNVKRYHFTYGVPLILIKQKRKVEFMSKPVEMNDNEFDSNYSMSNVRYSVYIEVS